MNKKAMELNLKNTSFVTPHGLDNNNHYTTAYDLAVLSDYALRNKIFSKIVKTKTYTISINNRPKTISNTNELLGNFEGIYGIKTGFTNGANRCLVTSCKRNDLDFICVVLGCDTKKDRTRDTINLLNYAFNNYSVINIKGIIFEKFNEWHTIHKDSFYVSKGQTQNLSLFLNESDFPFSNIALKTSDKIDVEIIFTSFINAPVYKKSKIGEAKLFINNTFFYSVDILNNNEIPKKNIIFYLYFILRNYNMYFHKNSPIYKI